MIQEEDVTVECKGAMVDNSVMRRALLILCLWAVALSLGACGSVTQPSGTAPGLGGPAASGETAKDEASSQPTPPERPSGTYVPSPKDYDEEAAAWRSTHCLAVRLGEEPTEICRDEEYWWLVDEGIGETGVANRDAEETGFAAGIGDGPIRLKERENPFRQGPKIEAPRPQVDIPGSPTGGGKIIDLR